MTENESSKFKIRVDDNPDSHFQLDNQDVRFDKLNRRLTLITILIPCLIGAIIFLVYRDINTRVGQVSYTGTNKVQTLSKDLGTRFSSLSTVQKELNNKIGALEKSSAALQTKLGKADTAIRQIRSARILDNRKTVKAIAVVNQNLEALASVPKDLETISADLKIVNNKFSKEMENYSRSIENIKNDLIKVQADFIALASTKIDKKTLDLALKNQTQTYQRLLSKSVNEINNKLASLENKISGAKTINASASKKSSSKSVTSTQKTADTDPAADIVKPKTTPQEKTAKSTTLPKPGTFIEQDIK